jgi:NADH-quinone oxidoreductase subunit D
MRAVKYMLRDRYLADMPIVIAAIDPCFSCTDRTVALNRAGGRKKEIIEWKTLRNYGIDWYKKQGVDFTGLNNRFKNGAV